MGFRVALCALVLAAAACDRGGASGPTLADRGRLVVVETATTGVAEERVTLLGDVHGEVEVRVFAQVPERIRTLHVREGDAVREGDPIATLDAALQATGVEQAGAALAAAEASRDQLRSELERARRLAASGAIPSAQVDALAAQLRSAEAQVTQLAAARRSAGAQRARTVVRAPASGTVALLAVQEGDTVAPTLPICTIVRAERVRILVRVTELDYVRIREGMPVEITLPSLPEAARAGTVTRISPVIDPLTRTGSVEIVADNADGRLRPGMIAQVAIALARREGVTMVPARAVVMTPDTDTDRTAIVFAVAEDEDGRLVARRRDVRIGARYGRAIEIVAGIEPGDRVVVEGQHLLRDGTRIRVAERAIATARASREGG
jgi:RND family efflux transporter MFP subunit